VVLAGFKPVAGRREAAWVGSIPTRLRQLVRPHFDKAMIIPEIETERLRMRPFSQEHLDKLSRIYNEPGVRKFLWDDEPVSPEMTRETIDASIESFANEGFGLWVLIDKRRDEVIGFCGLRHALHTTGIELLYAMTTERWGGGFTTEAARACLRHAFEQTNLNRIIAAANIENIASYKVLEKAGMKHDGRGRFNNEELFYYAISREDYEPDGSAYRLREEASSQD
jgi:ribosomal-protein-alanine N-acetyltransferase